MYLRLRKSYMIPRRSRLSSFAKQLCSNTRSRSVLSASALAKMAKPMSFKSLQSEVTSIEKKYDLLATDDVKLEGRIDEVDETLQSLDASDKIIKDAVRSLQDGLTELNRINNYWVGRLVGQKARQKEMLDRLDRLENSVDKALNEVRSVDSELRDLYRRLQQRGVTACPMYARSGAHLRALVVLKLECHLPASLACSDPKFFADIPHPSL